MNNQLAALQAWLDKHSERDKRFMFYLGFAVIYFLYFILFLHPIALQKKELQQNSVLLQTQAQAVKQQVAQIRSAVSSPDFINALAEEKKLIKKLDKMQQQISQLQLNLYSPEELTSLTKKILNERGNDTVLISLEELPITPWPQLGSEDKVNLANHITPGYQHVLQMEFQNDYFNTIDYLKRLEKLSQHMYWDSMDYKVVKYPKADVVIKFHVLSLQKSS